MDANPPIVANGASTSSPRPGVDDITITDYAQMYQEWVVKWQMFEVPLELPPALPKVWVFFVGQQLPVTPSQLPILQQFVGPTPRLTREWRIDDPSVIMVQRNPLRSLTNPAVWIFMAKWTGRTTVTYCEIYAGGRAELDFPIIVLPSLSN